MASLRVLTFDHEGRPIQFDTWLNDLQLHLLSNSRESVSLFDHTSGASLAPPATADSATCSHWLTRDVAARLAFSNHLSLAERSHFGKHKTTKALYDAVVVCYFSPATAALGHLLLPYLFPELSAFATVEDLVSHLRNSDTRYRVSNLYAIVCLGCSGVIHIRSPSGNVLLVPTTIFSSYPKHASRLFHLRRRVPCPRAARRGLALLACRGPFLRGPSWPVAGPLPPAADPLPVASHPSPVAGPLPPVAGSSLAHCRPSPAHSHRPLPVAQPPPAVARSMPAEPRRPTELHCPTCTAPVTTAASVAATAPTATMASPTVLTFDAEGRAVDFDVWVDDLQLFLQCDSRDGVSLFDHTSGASPAHTATADSTVRSQWTTRDAVARLAVRSHLPPAESAHFGQYKTDQSLYDDVVARYSSPATAALSRLMLPYLFPNLAAFATVADLVAHLRTSDARYRAALPTENHFLSLCPTELIVDLLEERPTAPEKSIVAVGASRGDHRTPFFEGCSHVPLLPSVASAAAIDLVGTAEVGAASAPTGRRRTSKGKGSKGGGGGGGGSSGGGGGGGGSGGGGGCGGGGGGSGGGGGGSGGGGGGGGGGGAGRGAAAQRGGFGGSQRQQQLRTRETPSVQQLREWYAGRGRSGGAGPCTYVLRTCTRSGEVCGLPHTTQRCFGRLTDAWRTQFPDVVELPRWHDLLLQNVPIFDLYFDAILAAMYALADSAEGDCYLSVPPDPGIAAAALGASASAALGAGASAAPCAGAFSLSGTAPTESLHTVTLVSGASRSFFRHSTTLTPLSRPVAVSLADPSGGPVLAHSSTVLPCPAAPSGLLSGLHLPSFSTNLVAASGQVFAAASRSSPASPPCSCRPLSHETLLWHHRLGHPSLPRLRGMASRTLVSGLPQSLPPLPPGPAPTCVPYVEGRQRAAPHSCEFPLTEAPLQTLHLDVWGPARVNGQGHERYFLLVVDEYSRYTTVFPLRRKGVVTETEVRHIGMVMDVARTSMIHASAPPYLWPFAVQYVAHQINLQPRVSLPETTPTLRWTGKVGDASAFRVWGSRAFVRETTADKLSSRAVPYVFLGFPPDAPEWQFYHPTSRRVLSSQDVTFDESVSYFHPAEPVEVAVDSGAARGAEPAGAGTGGAETGGAEYGGAESWRAERGGVEPEGTMSGDAEPTRAESGGSLGVPSRREPLSPQRLREWYSRRCRVAAGAGGAAGATGGGAGARGAA
ncbi:unnamed protein product [Closterium sp. NIES-53]